MAPPGFLDLTCFGEDGMIGSVEVSFEGGAVGSNFDVNFVEGEQWWRSVVLSMSIE